MYLDNPGSSNGHSGIWDVLPSREWAGRFVTQGIRGSSCCCQVLVSASRAGCGNSLLMWGDRQRPSLLVFTTSYSICYTVPGLVCVSNWLERHGPSRLGYKRLWLPLGVLSLPPQEASHRVWRGPRSGNSDLCLQPARTEAAPRGSEFGSDNHSAKCSDDQGPCQ